MGGPGGDLAPPWRGLEGALRGACATAFWPTIAIEKSALGGPWKRRSEQAFFGAHFSSGLTTFYLALAGKRWTQDSIIPPVKKCDPEKNYCAEKRFSVWRKLKRPGPRPRPRGHGAGHRRREKLFFGPEFPSFIFGRRFRVCEPLALKTYFLMRLG